MRRLLFAFTAFALTGVLVATAEDPKPLPAQPPAVQPKAIQPGQPRPILVTATKMAQLEEEYETLEAQRDVRKAYVKAAEVAVEGTKVRFHLESKRFETKVGAKEDWETARFDFEMAKAQLDIRKAELKEIEVKVKYAKKRLDDAKAAGVRPPNLRPVPIDPPPGQ